MRKIRARVACAFAAIATLCAVTSAAAADLPSRAPAYKAPLPVVAPSWTGFYVGASIGGQWANSEWTTTCLTPTVPGNTCPLGGAGGVPIVFVTNNPANFDSASVRGGIYGGYNWQVSPRWVVGFDGDVAQADNKKTIVGIPGTLTPAVLATTLDRSQVRATWDAGIRARVGYLIDPSLLVFVTGGASWLHLEGSAFCGSPAAGIWCTIPADRGATWTNTSTRTGWSVGGGLEWMWSRNWMIRGEYRYADYGTFSSIFFPQVLPGPTSDSVAADIKMRTHTAIFGLAYKLDWGGPVVASY